MNAELDRIRAEQRAAAEYLAENPGDRGATLWLADWFTEELLLTYSDTTRGGAR
jgi:hypothetical protein